MPELPEVETTKRGIEPHVVGRKVSSVLVRQSSLRWPVSPELGQSLTGQVITGVNRRGKYLFLETKAGRVMIHLGMSGSLRIQKGPTEPEKHDHIDIVFDDKSLLRYRDPRRFGSVFWVPEGTEHKLIASLGPEPLTKSFTADDLFRKSRGKKVSIKVFVMNSQVVVGVGNIYANEALFLAGIRPDKAAGTLSRVRFERLVGSIKQVLGDAIEAGGTTLRDFVHEDGSPGYFKQSLNVYDRGGLACTKCMRILKEIRLGQRTTVFCTKCQR